MTTSLGELIKQAREATEKLGKPLSQDDLAELMGRSKQWIGQIERGEKKPSLSLLVSLHEQLLGTKGSEAQVTLGIWLLAWVESHLQKDGLPPNSRAAIEKALHGAIDHLALTTVEARSSCRTLQYFPFASEPLTIVCGDRRELNPKTRGDIFAHSVSITDLTFLNKLELPRDVSIVSDKLFVLMEKDYLEKEFGKTNLLVIGSPAVNFLARLVNNHSVFRFNLPPWLKQKEKLIRTLDEPDDWDSTLPSLKELNERKNLNPFWQLALNPYDADFLAADEKLDNEPDETRKKQLVKRLLDKANPLDAEVEHVQQLARMSKRILGDTQAKELMNDFRIPGLVDFSDGTVHGTYTSDDNDFALISLAPNPFASSSDYVCVLVGGIHGPGTAHALRALAEDGFQEHPFGGVIEVVMDQFNVLWPARFQQATWRWQTKGYTAEMLLENLERIFALGDQRPTQFERLSSEEIKECLDFVRNISKMTC